jgi:hypothetical protein
MYMYKPLHIKLTIEQHTTPPKTGGKLSAPDRYAVFGTFGNLGKVMNVERIGL